MRRRLLFALLLAGCSSNTADNTPPENHPPCNYHADCPNDGVCFEKKCYGTRTCLERSDCNSVPVCEGQRCICSESQRCLPVCVTDDDCPDDGQCVNGVCTKYPVQWAGETPGGGARATLKVGLGRADLDFPMGVSMAGYATRRGPQTPYRDSLGGSNAWFDKLDVRAVAFDDGAEMFVLLRIPSGWSDDFLINATAEKVLRRTGKNLVDHLVSSAPHSHALPARFWHLVVGLDFGVFGYDEFSWEVFDRLTDSYADAVIMAIEDMQPARFGYTVLDDFDPQSQLHRDRRGQNDGLPGYMKKDDRMILMRVDDMAGQPLAFLTNFGVHGTTFDYDNPILTADTPGGIEVELTRHAQIKYGRPVLGVFVQGNAGDISPGDSAVGHSGLEQIQLNGLRAWAIMEPALDRIVTRADTKVSIVNGRVRIDHETLGYGAGEFHDDDAVCTDTPPYFRYGAFQCVDGRFDDRDPSTRFTDGDLNCVFSLECLSSGYPVPQFMKTKLSVVRLGDLAFGTMPGEPLSQFGRDLEDRLKSALPGIEDVGIIGYSQDHHFYLLNEPDWFQGGYEPSRDIWGWKLAPYLADKSVELAKELVKEPADRVWNEGNLKPMWWDDPPEMRKRVPPNETAGAPEDIVTEVPETVRRMDVVTFSWKGGHPGVDRPTITLEREVMGQWEPVKRPGGWIYTDGMFEMFVHYDGMCSRRTCEQHKWRVDWEEARDFPLGKYRFRAEGKHWKGGAAVAYTVRSRAFDLVANDRLELYGLAPTMTGVEGRIVDPAAVKLVDDPMGGKKVEANGHRLRSTLVPGTIGAPLETGTRLVATGTVRAPGGATTPVDGSVTVESVTEARQVLSGIDAMGAPRMTSAGMRPTSRFTLAIPAIASSGDYLVRLTLTDPSGNSGTVTATITRP